MANIDTPIWTIEGVALESVDPAVAGSLGDVVQDIQSAVGGGSYEQVTLTTGTLSFDETSAAEQTVVELTLSVRTAIGSIWLDLVNITQNLTLRLYHKIDGTNYRLFQENSWLTTDDDGVLLDGFTARDDVKVVILCGGGGAGSVDVPYAVT